MWEEYIFGEGNMLKNSKYQIIYSEIAFYFTKYCYVCS